jgi:hypothetical protein
MDKKKRKRKKGRGEGEILIFNILTEKKLK